MADRLELSEAEKRDLGALHERMRAAKCAFFDTVQRQRELAREQERISKDGLAFEREARDAAQKITERADLLLSVRGIKETHTLDLSSMTFVEK